MDFLVARDGKPWFLVEVKQRDEKLGTALEYDQKQLDAPFAFQVVFDVDYVGADCFAKPRGPLLVPARTCLSPLLQFGRSGRDSRASFARRALRRMGDFAPATLGFEASGLPSKNGDSGQSRWHIAAWSGIEGGFDGDGQRQRGRLAIKGSKPEGRSGARAEAG